MDNLLEIATYIDEEHGEVVQFIDEVGNVNFYKASYNNDERNLEKVDNELNDILEEKYYSLESDENEF